MSFNAARNDPNRNPEYERFIAPESKDGLPAVRTTELVMFTINAHP